MKLFFRVPLVAWLGNWARAEVVHVEIRERAPFAGGHLFGPAGPYEKIAGRLFIEVDPSNPANARICDLALAPRNASGRVECWSDFFRSSPWNRSR